MIFLYIKIMDLNYKEEILLALESADISKASSVEGIDLDNALTRDLPLFKGFFKNGVDKAEEVLIINALVENKGKIDDFVHLLKESGTEVEGKDILRVLAWPVEVILN